MGKKYYPSPIIQTIKNKIRKKSMNKKVKKKYLQTQVMKLKKIKIINPIIKLKINQFLIKVSRIKNLNQNIEGQNLKYHQILK
jgi:hypothetical protein